MKDKEQKVKPLLKVFKATRYRYVGTIFTDE
jgi:hypothetical protein